MSPFKSNAQRKLLFAKADRGEIPLKTVKEFAKATPNIKKLPEHVNKAYESAKGK